MSNTTQPEAKQEMQTTGEMASAFSSLGAFDTAQRMARVLTASSLVPVDYQDNLPNAIIALEMAQRIGASPLAVMQNLYIVHGKPGWSAQFIIASLNSCGRYSPLRFTMIGEKGTAARACVASALELATGETLEGPEISMTMAKAEGWIDKKGSKWKTMPEMMLRYRAASFFGKLYAPDILMGMQSSEELHDIIEGEIVGDDDLNAAIGVNTETGEIAEKPTEAKPEPIPGLAKEDPAFTFAEIADMINNAKDKDDLNLALDVIGAIDQPVHQAELQEMVITKGKALEG